MRRVLVAGIGNIFLGDDAFGCEVIRHLAQFPVPEGVTATDFGIRSYDLAYAIMDTYDQVILVDVVQRGETPGTVFLMKPEIPASSDTGQQIGAGHGMDPVSVLRMVKMLGGTSADILLVGCEPARFQEDEGDIGLSSQVKEAVPQAVAMIKKLIVQASTNHSEAEAASKTGSTEQKEAFL